MKTEPESIPSKVEGANPSEGAATNKPAIGDYVLATKYSDGDPGDAWALGFYNGQLDEQGRHYVLDSAGKNMRGNGYRRVGRIRGDVGRWLLGVAADQLERSRPGTVNLWTMLTENAFDLSMDTEGSAKVSDGQAGGATERSGAAEGFKKLTSEQQLTLHGTRPDVLARLAHVLLGHVQHGKTKREEAAATLSACIDELEYHAQERSGGEASEDGRDAERYRWLRDTESAKCAIFEMRDTGEPDPCGILVGGHADAFIDAAITASKGKGPAA